MHHLVRQPGIVIGDGEAAALQEHGPTHNAFSRSAMLM